ncbi:phosphoribosylaminoimidazole-succinocarboxamide synthase [Actinomycetota bacterium]|nr:phosphoribosylaminoimidazole-succinocarboxamide synthase [Actinomycetota bacterium]
MSTKIPNWKHIATGKVRELYVPEFDHPQGDVVLVVASDRISAFDYILDSEIPGKGAVLTQMSVFWFDLIREKLRFPTHFISATDVPDEVAGRAMLCKRLDMFEIECVARGYLTGSAFEEYKATGKYQEFDLPAGLEDMSKFNIPLFTPAAKAAVGDHDENIMFSKVVELIGADAANALRSATLEIFKLAQNQAAKAGLTLVDTKFEFGVDLKTSAITLGDEVLTPDSSRYLNATGASLDKQYVRNWLLNESGWDKKSGQKPPKLPSEVVEKTAQLYQEALVKLINTKEK